MRNADARDELVRALGKVPELAPAPSMPRAISAGAAWPTWFRTVWTNACLPVGHWYVFVALPGGGSGTTNEAGDELVDAVADELMAVGKLVECVPWTWTVELSGTAIPGLRYTLEV